ncbi:TPA: TVP38/TMEM64 family protein [Streptococcus equi subsp. zooepidemicus]|nr:TVP38/TMEM64 family protein [Streptococcus equi subsp. zooepidemicus]HEK9097114.1 TVP38/TMEM64 family protein [Streptococcus equi subsp. zooepidemicus]HEK9998873.1 TVP38/TMEM64 family protein [Streptococcus equi subsp. zooepidemicus]HEL0000803.1 TVP38/TMEM64 family protein [Streptococcus equi subsp. zooepidemicus]HEL0594443.1 TVP38/TMEM64 family protein [Streptococcus equi subsp. zooepidemicus]
MSSFGVSHSFLKKLFKILGGLSILLSVMLVVYLVRQLDIINNPKALAHLIEDHLLIGAICFFVLQIVQVVVPIIPGGVTTVVGFLAFGPILGFVLNVFGICIGSFILFKLVRTYGKPFILLFLSKEQLHFYEEKLSTKLFERFFILNMISPLAPADALIMITGLSQMTYKRFLLIILICRPISILTFSYFWIYGGEFLKHILMHY